MKKLVVFHPALAPYRIDFFNSLHEEFDTSFYFLHIDALEQSFNQDELRSKLHFKPQYLSTGCFDLKNLRWEVFSILRKENPDIVFCSEYNLLGVQVLLYRSLYKPLLKIFTVCDDSMEIAVSASGKNKWVRDKLVKSFNGVILANPQVQKWYKDTFSGDEKFPYFPIIQEDIRFRSELNKALPQSRKWVEEKMLKGKKLFLFVGRLSAVKNLSILIRAFSKIVQQHAEVFLIIVGEGEMRTLLEEEIKQLRLEQYILLVGKKQGEDLYAIYNIGQIFILPSTYEPFGAVVNEALLSGCYTLCSSVAGSAGLIEEKMNGALFSPRSENELVSLMEETIRQTAPLEEIEVKPNRMVKSYKEYFGSFIQQVKKITG